MVVALVAIVPFPEGLGSSIMIAQSLPLVFLTNGNNGRIAASGFMSRVTVGGRLNRSIGSFPTFRMAITEDGDENETSMISSSPRNDRKFIVGSLLQTACSRALRTLSTKSCDENSSDRSREELGRDSSSNNQFTVEDVKNVMDATIERSSSVLVDENLYKSNQGESDESDTASQEKRYNYDDRGNAMGESLEKRNKHQDKRTYLSNPGVTPTALAHSLWQSTIIPYRDTVIDCTCGNGKDCLALARMLFPDDYGKNDLDEIINNTNDNEDTNNSTNGISSNTNTHIGPTPQLIGIDIQSRAIHNSQRSLLSALPPETYFNHVSLLHQSHQHLMKVPRDTRSVGLICYNLGYLPGTTKETQTQTQTTLDSITDASLLLRVGGLLSIMTYPGSNLEESIAVEHFAEGLAMLTTRDEGGWKGYLEGIGDYFFDDEGNEVDAKDIDADDDCNDGGHIRRIVTSALERVAKEGETKQTWRAFVHQPLGRPLSPVLVTAMRIK